MQTEPRSPGDQPNEDSWKRSPDLRQAIGSDPGHHPAGSAHPPPASGWDASQSTGLTTGWTGPRARECARGRSLPNATWPSSSRAGDVAPKPTSPPASASPGARRVASWFVPACPAGAWRLRRPSCAMHSPGPATCCTSTSRRSVAANDPADRVRLGLTGRMSRSVSASRRRTAQPAGRHWLTGALPRWPTASAERRRLEGPIVDCRTRGAFARFRRAMRLNLGRASRSAGPVWMGWYAFAGPLFGFGRGACRKSEHGRPLSCGSRAAEGSAEKRKRPPEGGRFEGCGCSGTYLVRTRRITSEPCSVLRCARYRPLGRLPAWKTT